MHCPYCRFPLNLYLPPGMAGGAITNWEIVHACTVCKAKLSVKFEVVSPPAKEWQDNPARTTNAPAPAHGYCGYCHGPAPLTDLKANFGLCNSCHSAMLSMQSQSVTTNPST